MKRSDTRILTTHVGSLPRGGTLSDLLIRQEKGEAIDEGALSLEMANPRHQHEYETLRKMPLPDGMNLIPGVVESTSNYIEHPQVICNRLLEAVDAVGDRERVIGGSDCGFGTFAGWEFVATSIVWAKFESLRDGAALASAKLWS